MIDLDQELNDLVLFRKTQIESEEELLNTSHNNGELAEIQHENDEVFNSQVDSLIKELTYLKTRYPKTDFGVSFRKLIDYVSGMKQHRNQYMRQSVTV
ncbi:hypothetical protein ACFLYK_02855 [Candidatus Cloacimonadota bacterium]